MPYQSHLGDVLARLERARDAALVAAGEVVTAEVKTRLKGGYTTGDFVTGAVLNSVTATPPQGDGDARFVRVGTSISDPAYPLFWEIGHQNRFTRRFEHRPIWVPALFETRAEQFAAATAAARAAFGGGGGPTIAVSEAAD